MSKILDDKPSAVILRFPSKRGRPRSALPSKDIGTPELTKKRLMGETKEALDLCLERGIINSEQHWCGIHLRWLYTLRHGAPGVRALDPTHLGGIEIKIDDHAWKTAREEEYHDALNALRMAGTASIVMNLCVHNERPDFLKRSNTQTLMHHPKNEDELIRFIKGLEVLSARWILHRH